MCQGDVEGDKRPNPPHRCALSLLFSTSGDLVGDGGESRRARRQVLPGIGWARLADSSAQGISGLYLTPRLSPFTPDRSAQGSENRARNASTKIERVQRRNVDTENYPVKGSVMQLLWQPQ